MVSDLVPLLSSCLPGTGAVAGSRRFVALLAADLDRNIASTTGRNRAGGAWPAAVPPPGSAPPGFAAFYEAERVRIVAVVASLTGDRGAAEDIVQEAFATALRRWSVVSRYDRPGDWVKRVAVNRAISRFRRRTNEERALRRVASERDPLSRVHDGDDPLWNAVRALPRRQAQVISLMFIDDLTIERTAQTLGLSAGAVKSHLHRARTTLATVLQGGEDTDAS